ncbi:A/G-specific adenine glycosylase [Helicobacter fennelliae]|uniref:A/G-specific adenine glycosylase n=2 Tax=Helicobacter fennelliae TaxID=215 RepID=T1CRS2_9HELI|nr:A/G-specific adenine glycosylase [Helicobacter fennelliae]GAD19454.1 A/G-specific adenine glycosylase [Helicobacter fennelliae MRY12-0050]SQB97573.1 A/G-specific adenine glycosylase [Helicobacter fennelliae]STP06957.1 A/G-specific adenine glycosylase [Helicobacter fennelliae]STQ83496.1 A/G-specific adenine glycosylase [Helicobacter fennelliae]
MDIVSHLEAHLKIFHQCILEWYSAFGRKNLPWRNYKRDGSEAYKVYVSEIMLQQTQVSRVLESYFFPFLNAFPTLTSLANANTEEVLALWQGLGYYTRAQNMQKTARICVQSHYGNLPDNTKALLALPGIGTYSAGAILCFGFGQSVGFVDANIKRVFSRLFAKQNLTPNELSSLAQALLDKHHSFEYNQALLDIGATICTPKNPKCLICPISRFCKGRASWQLFGINKKTLYQNLTLNLAIILDKSQKQIALIKASQKLYNNLYNLPQIAQSLPQIPQIPPQPNQPQNYTFIGDFKHSYTKYKIHAKVWILTQSIHQNLQSQNPPHNPQNQHNQQDFAQNLILQNPKLQNLDSCKLDSQIAPNNTNPQNTNPQDMSNTPNALDALNAAEFFSLDALPPISNLTKKALDIFYRYKSLK